MNRAVDLSFIVVTFNNSADVSTCLASVYAKASGLTIEVIVVDNASSDGTPRQVEGHFPAARVVRRKTNGGFAVGVNDGIRLATGRALFVLNPDAELLDDGLSSMLAYMEQRPDIGLLAPKLLDTLGTVQLSCRTFPGFATALFNRYSLLTRLFAHNAASSRYLMSSFDHRTVADVDWVSGAAWLLPRSTIDAIGLLDQAYFWSIEDVDYCQRIHHAGLRVVYFPDVCVRHRIGASMSSAPARAIFARHKGMWRYYTKYMRPANTIVRCGVDVSIVAGIALRCAAQLGMSLLTRKNQSRSTSTGT